MMAWRSLSPRTIVAAAEAVARRKADGRSHAAGAPTATTAPGTGQGNAARAQVRHPVNDTGAAVPPRPAE